MDLETNPLLRFAAGEAYKGCHSVPATYNLNEQFENILKNVLAFREVTHYRFKMRI